MNIIDSLPFLGLAIALGGIGVLLLKIVDPWLLNGGWRDLAATLMMPILFLMFFPAAVSCLGGFIATVIGGLGFAALGVMIGLIAYLVLGIIALFGAIDALTRR